MAAELEELRVQAVSQGVEWLRRALPTFSAIELRDLATAANVTTHGADRNWLPMVQLRSALMNFLMPATEARVYTLLFDLLCLIQ